MQINSINSNYNSLTYCSHATTKKEALTNDFVSHLTNNGGIYTGIWGGFLATAEEALERFELIKTLKKDKVINPAGKEGKELVKLLKEKKLIHSIPRTLIFPFIAGASVMSVVSYGISKMSSKKGINA